MACSCAMMGTDPCEVCKRRQMMDTERDIRASIFLFVDVKTLIQTNSFKRGVVKVSKYNESLDSYRKQFAEFHKCEK